MHLVLPTTQRPWRASGRLGPEGLAAPRPRDVNVASTGEGGGSTSRDAVLARIKKAKEYKSAPKPAEPSVETPQQSSSTGGGSAGEGPKGAEAVLARIQKAKEYQRDGPSPAVPAASQPQQQQQQQQPSPPVAGGAAAGQTGGAEQAAGWLQNVVSKEVQLDANLRMEEITLQKDEEMKKQGAEIIVGRAFVTRYDKVDFSTPPEAEAQAAPPQAAAAAAQGAQIAQAEGSTALGAVAQPETQPAQQQAQQQQQQQQQEEDVDYKPKVATWGVFPRPQNISEAYGGGRNLRPGQALESEEQAKEREARVNAALQRYRKKLGMDVDPKDEAAAQALCEEGGELFKQGAIALALEKYAAAVELVPSRCQVGGEARLQQAICLDSLGRSNEAYEIYKTVKSHPNAAIAKQANRMLFGFKAAESLKVGNLSYAPSSQAWQDYFNRISKGSWNASYYAKEGGEEEGGEGAEAWILWVAAGVVVAPLALLLVKVVSVRL